MAKPATYVEENMTVTLNRELMREYKLICAYLDLPSKANLETLIQEWIERMRKQKKLSFRGDSK